MFLCDFKIIFFQSQERWRAVSCIAWPHPPSIPHIWGQRLVDFDDSEFRSEHMHAVGQVMTAPLLTTPLLKPEDPFEDAPQEGSQEGIPVGTLEVRHG
jgi:hypothetical protein